MMATEYVFAYLIMQLILIKQVLVWSGACRYGNRNIFNFGPVEVNGVQQLSFWLPALTLGDDIPEEEQQQSGVMMNNQYEEVGRTFVQNGRWLDGHEFNVLNHGETVLLTTIWWPEVEAHSIGQEKRHLVNTGFQEVNMKTGEILFDWDPLEKGLLLNESLDLLGMADTTPKKGKKESTWDWFHINSVDKFVNGDYLVSGRHTHAVYKVSAEDGSVRWRLGGTNSDFVLEDNLPFHWQHHARIRSENMTHTILSVFDNASDDQGRNPDYPAQRSAGKIMVLDHSAKPMTAKMLRRFDRPDGDHSPALGSVQQIGENIETSNIFVNWAFDGYVSEYDAQNRLLLEARFLSGRFRSYRAYKHPWVGKPTEIPAFTILPIGSDNDKVSSAFYVSWNGATEVSSWAFYGGDTLSKPLKRLATIKKHGFETSHVEPGVVRYAYAVALDIHGNILSKSNTTTITPAVDGDYKISQPLLQDAKAAEVVPTDETVKEPSHWGFSKASDNTQSSDSDYSGKAVVTKATRGAPYFVVVGFALFGLFCAVRNLLGEIRRRQKGYSAVSGYYESP